MGEGRDSWEERGRDREIKRKRREREREGINKDGMKKRSAKKGIRS